MSSTDAPGPAEGALSAIGVRVPCQYCPPPAMIPRREIAAHVLTQHLSVAEAKDRWAYRLINILSDLDRCQHGRHEGDPCGSCGGLSTGNPYPAPGRVIGHGVYGNPIVLPTRDRKTDPAAWRHTTTAKDNT
ncbi:hypothetical protein [Streptomyces chartreusis]|uniref:hypothetical protein n=1 Tax=Streptomyces chartreusis TaxID=1969 RepID=UPI003803B8DC